MTGPTRYAASRDDLVALLDGLPRYRVDQVWQGLYQQLAAPEELTSLPKGLRARLDASLPLALEPVTVQAGVHSEPGGNASRAWRCSTPARAPTCRSRASAARRRWSSRVRAGSPNSPSFSGRSSCTRTGRVMRR